MPETAISTDARAIVMVDAATEMDVVGVWIDFQLAEGGCSCQNLIGRAFLADKDSTIPKNELQAMCAGGNLGWEVDRAL